MGGVGDASPSKRPRLGEEAAEEGSPERCGRVEGAPTRPEITTAEKTAEVDGASPSKRPRLGEEAAEEGSRERSGRVEGARIRPEITTAEKTAGVGGASPSKRPRLGKETAEEGSPERSGRVEGAGEDDVARCGICLAEGQSIRGEIDSCGHFFCFICIMAWARIESRCPFCKLRFRSIRRPPVPGLLPLERLVPVAERNQVYHPLGNESIAPRDPVANTNCSVCNCSREDMLLLVCGLCDSAAHTYCVGLAYTAPEGDWYCPDCATCKEEHLKGQQNDESVGDQDSSKTDLYVRRTEPVVSISDIVADRCSTWNSARRRTAWNMSLQRHDEDLPSESRFAAGLQHAESSRGQNYGRISLHVRASYKVEMGARTLNNHHHLNDRVSTLRENWAALRAGSLGFSSALLNSGKRSGVGTTSGVMEQQRCSISHSEQATTSSNPSNTVNRTLLNSCKRSGVGTTSGVTQQQQCAISRSEQATTSSNPSNTVNRNDTRDVCKSWRLLEMAKSAGGMKTSSKPCTLNSCGNRNVSGEARSFPPVSFSMGNRATGHSLIDTIGGPSNQRHCQEVCHQNIEQHDRGKQMKCTPSPKNLQDCHRVPTNLCATAHEKYVPSQETIARRESLNDKIGSSSRIHYVRQTVQLIRSTGKAVEPKSDVRPPQDCSLSVEQSASSSLQELRPSNQRHARDVSPDGLQVSCMSRGNDIDDDVICDKVKTITSAQSGHGRKRKLGTETSDASPCVPQTAELLSSRRAVKHKFDARPSQEYNLSVGQSPFCFSQELRPCGQNNATDMNTEGQRVSCMTRSMGIDDTAVFDKLKTSWSAQSGHGCKRKLGTETSDASPCVPQTAELLRSSRREVKHKFDARPSQEYNFSVGQSTFSSQELRPSGQNNATDMNPEGLRVSCMTRNIGIDDTALCDKVQTSWSAQSGHGRKREHGTENSDAEGSSRRSSPISKTAKSEISLLVTRELQLLKIHKTYGSERFKEVARAATHTILAACGFEHSEGVALEYSRPVCNHSQEKSIELGYCVIPDSCKECFSQFVKEVVSAVLSLIGC